MPKETANGFGNRFLWVFARRQRSLPDGGLMLDCRAFEDRLRAVLNLGKRAGEMHRDAPSAALWTEVYPSLTLDRDDRFGHMTARAAPQVVRLSCLFALGDGSDTVGARHLRAALEFWRYARATVAFLWSDSLGDRRADELLAALKGAGRGGFTQSDILRHVFQRNVKVEELARIGGILQAAGLLDRRQDASRGGRAAMRWYYREPVQHECEESSGGGADTHSGAFAAPVPNDSNDRSPATEQAGPTSVVTVVGSSASEPTRDPPVHAAGGSSLSSAQPQGELFPPPALPDGPLESVARVEPDGEDEP